MAPKLGFEHWRIMDRSETVYYDALGEPSDDDTLDHVEVCASDPPSPNPITIYISQDSCDDSPHR